MTNDETPFPVPDSKPRPDDPYVLQSQLADQVNDLAGDVENLTTAVGGKQDALTAGDNITIVDNVISATESGGGVIAQNFSRQLWVEQRLIGVTFSDNTMVEMLPAGPLRPPCDYAGEYQYNDYWLDASGGCGIMNAPTLGSAESISVHDMDVTEEGEPVSGWNINCDEHGLVVGEGLDAMVYAGAANIYGDLGFASELVEDLTFASGNAIGVTGDMLGGFPIEVELGRVVFRNSSHFLPGSAVNAGGYDYECEYDIYGHLYADGPSGISTEAVMTGARIRWTRYRFDIVEGSQTLAIYAEGWVTPSGGVTADLAAATPMPARATFQPRALASSWDITYSIQVMLGSLPHEIPDDE